MSFWDDTAGSYFSHTDLPFAWRVSGEQFKTAVRVWSWQSHFSLCLRAVRAAPRHHMEQSCISLRKGMAPLWAELRLLWWFGYS